jgi:uncharacterized protein YfaS (alpha-2-macroglobulin family)
VAVVTGFVASCRPAPLSPAAAQPQSQASRPPRAGSAILLGPNDPAAAAPALPAPVPLAIQEFGPTGNADEGAEPWVRFSRQVASLGEAMLAAPELRIELEPKVAGRTRWRTSELLVFEPRALAPAQHYLVRVVALPGASPALVQLLAAHPVSFSFDTPGPGIADSFPDRNAPPESWSPRRAVVLRLTQPVGLRQLRQALSVQATPAASSRHAGDEGRGTPPISVPVRVDSVSRGEVARWPWAKPLVEGDEPLDGRLFAVRPVGAWPLEREVRLTVAAGLVGRRGPTPSAAPWTLTWETPGPVRVESLRAEPGDCRTHQLVLRFSERISRTQLSRIHVSPRPRDLRVTLEAQWDDHTGEEVWVEGSFEPARTYSVQVDPQLRDVQGYTLGEGTAGAPWTGTVALGAEPSLAISASGIFPAGDPPLFGLSSRWVKTVRVRVAALDARHAERVLFQHFKRAQGGGYGGNDAPATLEELGIPAGEIVVRDIPLAVTAPTYWSDLALDLRDLIHGDRRGVFWVEALPLELVPPPSGMRAFKSPPPVRALLRRTDLAPISFNSLVRSVLKVIRLSDGSPIPHATVSRIEKDREARLGETDAQGLFVWAPPPGAEALADTPLVIRETATQDMALLPGWPPMSAASHGARAGQTQRAEPGSRPGAHDEAPLLRRGERMLLSLTPDRDAFRPQESIALCGFALVDTPWAPTGLRTLPAGTTARIRAVDANQKVVAEQSLGLDETGKLWTRLPLAAGASLGGLQVTAEVQGATVTTHVKLEDFRTPAFEVTAEPARPAILIGESVPFHLAATHYSGVPVVLDKVAYASQCVPWMYRVPGLSPEWDTGAEDRAGHTPKPVRQEVAGAHGRVGRLDLTPRLETGGHTSLRCNVEIEATDASQQPIGTTHALQIHPASFYLAVRTPAGAHVGARAEIRVRALELDGQRRKVPGVGVKITRSWREEREELVEGRIRTRGQTRHEVAASCRLTAGTDADAICPVEQLQKGTYVIEARALDGTRTALTRATFVPWDRPALARGKASSQADAAVPRVLTMDLLDHDPVTRIAPGEALTVALQSPCEQGRGVVSVARAGLREQHDFVLRDHRATVELVVKEAWVPGFDVEAVTFCRAGREPLRMETSSRYVLASTAHRELKVELSVPAQARPRQALPVDVEVRDSGGRPVKRGHVALWAVDEAVLALGSYRIESPRDQLLPRSGGELATFYESHDLLRPYVASKADPWLPEGDCKGMFGLGSLGSSGYGSGAGGLGGRASRTVKPARARFETTPIFLGDVRLDEQGRAHVEGRLPDDLTTFRVTALASAPLDPATLGGSAHATAVPNLAPARFGVGEASVRVTAPLIVRPALPRQMRPGDTAEIAALVQNRSGVDGQLVVDGRIVGGSAPAPALVFVSQASVGAPLAIGGEVRVPFTVKALGAGTPQVELRARFSPAHGGPALEDAVSLPLPIAHEASLREHTAHYGTLDSAAPEAIAVRFPPAAAPDAGGISLSLSTSLLGELQDAFQYLLDYPYGCLEQTSSRVLALVAARELGQRFGLDGAEAARRLGLGIERMLSMQTGSGGFSYWTGEGSVHPYASAFATWVLLLARKAGTSVPAPALDRALDYLAREVDPVAGVKGDDGTGPTGLARASAAGMAFAASRTAIALDVLAEAGRPLPRRALDEALAARAQLPTFARTLLLTALAKTADPRAPRLVEELVSGTSELAGTAHVRDTTSSEWDDLFHSQNRSDAMTLRALLQARPDHPVVSKLVRGLLDARQGGRWRNTQENAYALLAVLEYARRFEAARPAIVARAWIGDRPWFETSLDATTPSVSRFLPLPALPSLGEPTQVVIQRQGTGRVAYRLGTIWQEQGDALPARDQGIGIARELRLRDTPEHAPGSGPARSPVQAIPLGETVAFDLTLKTRAPVSYVAIDVPVPAGLEPILDDLGQGHGASRLGDHGNGVLVSHEERHPDRVLVFIDHLPAGEHRHTIQLRATSLGDFALPPARAEAMYAPEIYGRTSSSRLRIKGAP